MPLNCLVDIRHTARTLIPALFLLGMSNAQAATGLPASPDNPMPADGEETKSFDVNEGTSFAVAVSPDGKHLAIDLQGSLWIVPAKGGRAHRITDYYNDAHLPSWSPDGTKLAFYAFRDGSYNLWTVGAEGSNPRRITNGEFDDRDPAWSPDGKTIAFASERGGSYDIWTLELASKRLNRLTSAPEADRAPVWSSDGSMLVFSRNHASGSAIMAIAAAGGEPRELQSAPSGMHYLAPSLSPRGRLSYVVQDATGSRLQVDGETVSATQNVFPFRASWHGENAYYTADGVIRRHGSSGTSKVPFVARLEATPAFL